MLRSAVRRTTERSRTVAQIVDCVRFRPDGRSVRCSVIDPEYSQSPVLVPVDVALVAEVGVAIAVIVAVAVSAVAPAWVVGPPTSPYCCACG